MLALRGSSPTAATSRPYWERARVRIVVGHLYPEYLNIYADRGNIAVLERRAAWRGHELDVRAIGVGDAVPAGERPLLRRRRPGPRAGADRPRPRGEGRGARARRSTAGAALLAVCGGYQLLGRFYLDTNGVEPARCRPLPARDGRRRAADDRRRPARVRARARRAPHARGFENHAGRTHLDAGAEPLGRVVAGFGNDGESGFEGCRVGRAVGTYLHGPLLPRNPWLADWLLAQALAHAAGGDPPARAARRTSSRLRRTRSPRSARATAAAASSRLATFVL